MKSEEARRKETREICDAIKRVTGKDSFRCSICGEFFYGWGNNPYPVTTGEDDRCCDACNTTKVIPARLKMAQDNREEGK